MNIYSPKNLSAFLATTGTEAKPDALGFVTLSVATHYFPIPGTAEGFLGSVHLQTGALIAGTFTVESCNYPGPGNGADGITDYDETAGGVWVPVNVAAAGYAQSVGTGWTVTVLSLAKLAGAGAAMISLINPAWSRLRLKAAVSTGGTVRVRPHGKQ